MRMCWCASAATTWYSRPIPSPKMSTPCAWWPAVCRRRTVSASWTRTPGTRPCWARPSACRMPTARTPWTSSVAGNSPWWALPPAPCTSIRTGAPAAWATAMCPPAPICSAAVLPRITIKSCSSPSGTDRPPIPTPMTSGSKARRTPLPPWRRNRPGFGIRNWCWITGRRSRKAGKSWRMPRRRSPSRRKMPSSRCGTL